MGSINIQGIFRSFAYRQSFKKKSHERKPYFRKYIENLGKINGGLFSYYTTSKGHVFERLMFHSQAMELERFSSKLFKPSVKKTNGSLYILIKL